MSLNGRNPAQVLWRYSRWLLTGRCARECCLGEQIYPPASVLSVYYGSSVSGLW